MTDNKNGRYDCLVAEAEKLLGPKDFKVTSVPATKDDSAHIVMENRDTSIAQFKDNFKVAMTFVHDPKTSDVKLGVATQSDTKPVLQDDNNRATDAAAAILTRYGEAVKRCPATDLKNPGATTTVTTKGPDRTIMPKWNS